MKTPREVIVERHQSAEAKLRTVRAEDLAACARAAAEAGSERQPKLSVAVVAGRFWLEALWPWRRVWAGVAAGWVVILALNLPARDTPASVSPRPGQSSPEVQAVLQQQEQLLSQLLGLETPPHVSRARTPGPRSAVEPARGIQWQSSRLETTLLPDVYAKA